MRYNTRISLNVVLPQWNSVPCEIDTYPTQFGYSISIPMAGEKAGVLNAQQSPKNTKNEDQKR